MGSAYVCHYGSLRGLLPLGVNYFKRIFCRLLQGFYKGTGFRILCGFDKGSTIVLWNFQEGLGVVCMTDPCCYQLYCLGRLGSCHKNQGSQNTELHWMLKVGFPGGLHGFILISGVSCVSLCICVCVCALVLVFFFCVCVCVCVFVCLFVRSFVCSFVRSFVCV